MNNEPFRRSATVPHYSTEQFDKSDQTVPPFPLFRGERGTVEQWVEGTVFDMSSSDFKPIICRRCGTVVWSGISWAGFSRLLDKQRLTIEEEIIKRLSGLKTYELHRTRVSFEAVERCVSRIKFADPGKDRVVLADHHCANMSLFETLDDAPNYWPQPVMATSPVEGMPF